MKNNNLIITEADKKIRLVILEKSIYNNLALEHLQNNLFYEIKESDPKLALNQKIAISLDYLYKNYHINKKLFNFFNNVLPFHNKIGSFRILPNYTKINLV